MSDDEVPLKVYIDQRFSDQDKAVQATLLAAEKAVTKAEISSDKRFDAVNEFRAQLTDQTATFITRAEYEAQHAALQDRVSELTNRFNTNNGQFQGDQLTKANIYTVVTVIILAAGVAVALVTHK